jgi:hypothetical protein
LPCAFHFISSIVNATHAPTNHKWYDPLHIIMWPYWFIDLDFTCSLPLLWSIGAKSCSSFTITRGPSLQSLWLTLHTCNRSVEPSHVLIFSTLITWLNVMSHAKSSFIITCVSLTPSSSHLHCHGICCSHTCTCGLINHLCISHQT